MAKKFYFEDQRTYNLEVTASEKEAFERTNNTGIDSEEELLLAAYLPAKEILEKLFQQVVVEEANPELKGKSLMLDFCQGHPQLGITIDSTTLYTICAEWVTDVYHEDAFVNAIDTITGLNHTYVASKWRKNAFYEWKF